jgi:hypothetical protein
MNSTKKPRQKHGRLFTFNLLNKVDLLEVSFIQQIALQ